MTKIQADSQKHSLGSRTCAETRSFVIRLRIDRFVHRLLLSLNRVALSYKRQLTTISEYKNITLRLSVQIALTNSKTDKES